MMWPVIVHMESGYKAMLWPEGHMNFWRRWSDTTGTYVECGSPL